MEQRVECQLPRRRPRLESFSLGRAFLLGRGDDTHGEYEQEAGRSCIDGQQNLDNDERS